MPSTPLKNLIYAALLPLSVSPRGRMTTTAHGQPLVHADAYLRLQEKHHVLGSSLLLRDGEKEARLHTSVGGSVNHTASDATLYRVASITKMATAIVTLRLAEEGLLTPDSLVTDLMPALSQESALQGVTVAQLLSHTSGLRDVPAYTNALNDGQSVVEVLRAPGVRSSEPGVCFSYSNFGFGLLGCIIEQVTGEALPQVFDRVLFHPLGMNATIDASKLEESTVMGIRRVIARSAQDVRITKLGRKPLDPPDPLHHFGHTAGAMYTDVQSLDRMLAMLAHGGALDGVRILQPETVAQMTTVHAAYGPAYPTLHYGWGILLVDDPTVSAHRLLGHQGFAYGCTDCSFWEEGTGRRVTFLNGGASELREGRIGRVNLDVLRWALREEMPAWR